MGFLVIILSLLAFCCTNALGERVYCSPGDKCWPTDDEIQKLSDSLDPQSPRTLFWQGGTSPRVSAVPEGSDQPLYGLGENNLRPVYTMPKISGVCFEPVSNPLFSEYCNVSVRSRPQEGWMPAFTIWPLTAEHVQLAVKFAISHNLCISVAGTGHDLLNRHTCPNGFFIRTSLMKEITWDLRSTTDAPAGRVRLGVGIVFSEIQKSASEYGRFIASGRCFTVGVVGWHLGGGRGFFAPGAGLGVDQILEADIVISDGTLITVNSTHYSDLFWALRGGGGSTWGVLTSITVRAHNNPEGGFTVLEASWKGTMCGNSESEFDMFLDNYSKVMLSMDKRFGTVAMFFSSHSPDSTCNTTWHSSLLSVFQGAPTENAFQAFLENINAVQKSTDLHYDNFYNWYEGIGLTYPLSKIIPTANNVTGNVGSIPTVLVSRETVESGQFTNALRKKLKNCKISPELCGLQMLHHDLTGNIGSPQEENVCISTGFRTALLNWGIYAGTTSAMDMDEVYDAVGEHCYFNESAYEIDRWAFRYWGSNYPRLQQIKQKYDPKGVFWCRHCVELPNEL